MNPSRGKIGGRFQWQREADKIHLITCFGESIVARTMTRNERQPRRSSLLLPSFYNLIQPLPLYLSIESPDYFVFIPCLLVSTSNCNLIGFISDLHLQHQTRLRPPSTLPDTFLPRATTKLLSLSQSTCKPSTSPSRQSSSPHFRMEIWGLELNPKYLLVPALR